MSTSKSYVGGAGLKLSISLVISLTTIGSSMPCVAMIVLSILLLSSSFLKLSTTYLETIDVNVLGSENVFQAAQDVGAEQVVAISTDKATAPINTYGMTKAIMERMVGEFAKRGLVKYTACRYGNVVGSTGSVIPLFLRQLEEKGSNHYH